MTKITLHVACLLILVGSAIFQLTIALNEQRKFSDIEGPVSLDLHETNPRLLTWQGKQKHMFDADLDTAELFFKKALITNALYIPAWLALAEVRYDKGKSDNAHEILEYIDVLTQNVKRWRWEKALTAYQLNREDILANDLSYIIKEIPGKNRTDACRMVFATWKNFDLIKLRIGNENIGHLFRFAVSAKDVDNAIELWPDIEKNVTLVSEKDVYSFIEMLMAHDRVNLAAEIWRQRFNPDSIVYNGAFKKIPLQRAFGWRIAKSKGGHHWQIIANSKTNGESALHVRFDGKKNINYHHVYQVIPVSGGSNYLLKSKVKSENLTTDQRPFWEIYGYDCKGLYTQSEMFEEEQDWHESTLGFMVPEKCDAVVMRLRRKESVHIDNKLKGDVWLKDIVLQKTTDQPIMSGRMQ